MSRGYVATLVALALLPIIFRDPVLWLPVVFVGLPASLGAVLAIYPLYALFTLALRAVGLEALYDGGWRASFRVSFGLLEVAVFAIAAYLNLRLLRYLKARRATPP